MTRGENTSAAWIRAYSCFSWRTVGGSGIGSRTRNRRARRYSMTTFRVTTSRPSARRRAK